MGLSKNLGGMYRDVFLQCVRRSGRYCILPVLRTQTGASCAVLPIIKPDLAFAFFRCKTWGQGEAQRDPFSTTYLAEFLDRTDFGSLLWKEAMKRGYGSAKETVFIEMGRSGYGISSMSALKTPFRLSTFTTPANTSMPYAKRLNPTKYEQKRFLENGVTASKTMACHESFMKFQNASLS